MTVVLQMNIAGQPEREPVELPPGRRRLSTIIAKRADRRRPHIVSVHRAGTLLSPEDHTTVMRARWKHRLVGPRDVVLITYLPRGGGGGGAAKQIGSAIGVLALAIAAPFALTSLAPQLFGTLGSLTLAGRLVAAGIAGGGKTIIK